MCCRAQLHSKSCVIVLAFLLFCVPYTWSLYIAFPYASIASDCKSTHMLGQSTQEECAKGATWRKADTATLRCSPKWFLPMLFDELVPDSQDLKRVTV